MAQVGEREAYEETTSGIRITVAPIYSPERSAPERRIYAFSYSVTLENLKAERVQLLNRHWIVESGGKQIADVKGEGVVGEQPIIEAGSVHQYTSGTVIHDMVGAMYGCYTFVTESHEFFDVAIPVFHLIYADDSAVH